MQELKEDEFRELVSWVTDISRKIEKKLPKEVSPLFNNVTYKNVVGALLRLLDQKILGKEL